MPDWKNILSRYLFHRKQPHIILVYHRIYETNIDPWEMCVQPDNFEDHLKVLAEDYTVLPLSSLPFFVKPDLKKPILFITFDDGYFDNYTTAFPLLKQYNLPATFFIPTQILQGEIIFWWEIAEAIFLNNISLPSQLKLIVKEKKYEWNISQQAEAAEKKWSAWSGTFYNNRQQTYVEIGDIMKRCNIFWQQEIIRQLSAWCGLSFDAKDINKMSAQQIQQVHTSGLIEIGAHSIYHPALNYQTEEDQLKEITGSKKQLENLLSAPVKSFCYPHGEYNAITKKFVQEAGFTIACTTEESNFTSENNLLELPRIWIKNWNKNEFKTNMKKWMRQNLLTR